MELRHLRYFVTVADELSFSGAARVLRISQPPLSQQIAALEKELGVRLFDRNSRRVELTDTGRALLHEAREVLRRTGDIQRAAAGAVDGRIERPLRLGGIPSAFARLLPAVIPAFKRKHPHVPLLVEARDLADQTHALLRGELDVGVLRTVDPVTGLNVAAIAEEPLMAALPGDHPRAADNVIRLEDLKHDDFIVIPRSQGPDYVDQITASCRSVGFSPTIAFEPENDQIMLGLVACGLGVAVVPGPITSLTVPNVVFRQLTDPTLLTTLCLVEPAFRPSPYFAELLDLASSAHGGSATSWSGPHSDSPSKT